MKKEIHSFYEEKEWICAKERNASGFFGRIPGIDFIFHVFLCRNEGGLGKSLVMFRDFNLLAVFKNLFQVVAGCGELAEFAIQFFLHLGTDLVGPLGYDGNGLIDVAGLL